MLFYTADPDLRQNPAFPRCCLSKWSLQELFANLRDLTTTPEARCAKNWGRMQIGKENDIRHSDVRSSGGIRDSREKAAGMRNQGSPPFQMLLL